jgi:glucokinase
MVLDRDLLRAARPGDLGSFETLASGVGVAMLARDALRADGSHSSLRSLPHEVTSFDLFAAADAGDATATDIIASVVDHVAMVVIALGSVVDPDVVVLDGSVGLALGRWAPDIEALAARHLPTHPRVLTSSLAGEATALGAVAAALDLSRAGRGTRASRPVGARMPRPAAMAAAAKGVGGT